MLLVLTMVVGLTPINVLAAEDDSSGYVESINCSYEQSTELDVPSPNETEPSEDESNESESSEDEVYDSKSSDGESNESESSEDESYESESSEDESYESEPSEDESYESEPSEDESYESEFSEDESYESESSEDESYESESSEDEPYELESSEDEPYESESSEDESYELESSEDESYDSESSEDGYLEYEYVEDEYPEYEYEYAEGNHPEYEYEYTEDEHPEYEYEYTKDKYPEYECEYTEDEYHDDEYTLYEDAIEPASELLSLFLSEIGTFAVEYITVYMSFEGYNLGDGFYIPPTPVMVPAGSSALAATSILLTGMNVLYDAPVGFLDRVYGFFPRSVPGSLPSYLDGITLGAGSADGSLGSNDFANWSGWMVTVNHFMFPVGADSIMLFNGDVIRWQFSVEWGDLGVGGAALYSHANKTELIRALFMSGVDVDAVNHAHNVIINPLATATEVEAALNALRYGMPVQTVDKDALNALILQAETRNQADYTVELETPWDWDARNEPWEVFQTALEAAQNVVADSNATQATVDGAVQRLQTAMDALVPIAPPDSPEIPDWSIALNGALGWLLQEAPDPSLNNEWAVLAIARANIDAGSWYDSYLSNLYTALNQGSTTNAWTDYARVTLALTALGIDASNFNGQDLIAPFGTFIPNEDRPAHSVGVNADIFALIALNTRPYSGDQQQFVESILAAQTSSGGWDGWGWGAEVDTTAMAIQALAPYYNNNSTVTAAITNAIEWISTQFINGPEEYAQIVVALTALGYDPGEYVTKLLAFYDAETGGFRSASWYWEGMTGGGIVNAISTEQATYALVAYYRFVNGMNTLYDMRDADNWTVPPPPEVPLPPGGGGGGWTPPVIASSFISVRDGAVVFFEGEFNIEPGETAYSLLHRTGLDIESRAGYIVSINGLAEFDYGPLSGWMFRINNGSFPPFAASEILLQDGDIVEWLYTHNLGEDIGGDTFPGADTATGSETVTIDDDMLFLSINSINELIQNDMPLTIQTAVATVTFDLATLRGLVYGRNGNTAVQLIVERINTGDSSTLTQSQRAVVGNNTVISITLMVGDDTIYDFAGTVTVSIPFTPTARFPVADRDLLTVYHFDDESNIREMMGARFHNGAMIFTTNHFSTFFISEWISPFVDVSRGDWYLRAVRFAYSKGLLVEYYDGEIIKSEEFSPYMYLTYSTFARMLRGLADKSTHLEEYEVWFDIENYLSLEQIVLLFKDLATFLEIDTELDICAEYAEYSECTMYYMLYNVSLRALPAMQWAIANNIIIDQMLANFEPRNTVTRAEAVEMLRLFYENVM